MTVLDRLLHEGSWRVDGEAFRGARFHGTVRDPVVRKATVEGLAGRVVSEAEGEAVLAEALLGLRRATDLVTLELHLHWPTNAARVLAALVSRVRPALRHLVITCDPEGPSRPATGSDGASPREDVAQAVPATTAAALAQALPALTQLTIRGRGLLPGLRHPRLRELDVGGYRAITGLGEAAATRVEVPALRRLRVILDRREAPAGPVHPGIGLAQTPDLRELDLRGLTGWFDPGGASIAAFLHELADTGVLGAVEWLGLPVLVAGDTMHIANWRRRLPRLRELVVDRLDDAARVVLRAEMPRFAEGRKAAVWVETVEARTARERAESLLDDRRATVETLIAKCGGSLPALRELTDRLPRTYRPWIDPALQTAQAALATALDRATTFDERRAATRSAAPYDVLPEGAWARLGRPPNLRPVPLLDERSTSSAADRLIARVDPGSITIVNANGVEVSTVPTHRRIGPVAFAGDDWLLAGADDGTVTVWDWPLAHPIAVFHGHLGPVTQLAASTDGRLAASQGPSRTIVFDLTRLEAVTTLEGERALPPRGSLYLAHGLVVARWGPEVRAIDPATGRPTRARDRLRRVDGMAISPDGRHLLTTPDVTWWDLDTLTPIARLGHAGRPPGRVAFAPDGRHWAAIIDRRATVFDANGATVAIIDEPAIDLTFAGSKQLVVTTETQVTAWSVPDGERRWSQATPRLRPTRIVASPTGEQVAFGAFANHVAVLDATIGARIAEGHERDDGSLPPTLQAMAWTAHGVVTSTGGPRARTYGFAIDGSALGPLVDVDDRTLGGPAMAWSADGRRAAFARSREPAIELYEGLRHVQTLRTPGEHVVTDLAFTLSGESLISAGRDATMLLWNP